MFRAVAARMNHLSQDRPDITFATMNLSRPDARFEDMKKATGWVSVCTPLLTPIGNETNNQRKKVHCRTRTSSDERTCCMREPVGECQPGTSERKQADMTARPRSFHEATTQTTTSW